MKKVVNIAMVLFCQACLLTFAFAGEFSRPSFRVREESDKEFNTPSFSLANQGEFSRNSFSLTPED